MLAIPVTLLAVVYLFLAGTFFTLYSSQFGMIQAGRTALQAQQYAEIEADTLKLLSYDDLDATGAHARQAITAVAGADGWQDEITIAAEQTYGADAQNKQRIATIKVYKDGDTLSRYSLQVPLSSKGSGGVPTGTVIWYAAVNPPKGFIVCNGQSTSGYSKLASIVGSNVPDLQGAFIRGYGEQSFTQNNGNIIGNTTTIHQSGNLGECQGDSLRKIYGYISMGHLDYYGSQGVFSHSLGGIANYGTSVYAQIPSIYFDSSRIIPTSNEIRPFNVALLPCIKY